MNVSDIMHKRVTTVGQETAVSEVARIIFNLGISGVPVISSDNMLLGIVTEEDLLRKLFPSVKDVMEDWVRSHRYEHMEDKLSELINTPVKHIMNQNVTAIAAETPLMQAEALMLVNGFSR